MTIYSCKAVDNLIERYGKRTDNFCNGGIIKFDGDEEKAEKLFFAR